MSRPTEYRSAYKRTRQLTAIILAGFILTFTGCELFENLGEQENDVTVLDGKWFRIESNNPVNDNMVIEVEEATGTVTDKANSGFQNGDIKWRNIEAVSEDLFDYEELGSDGNYYSAQMELADDTTLLLSVGSTGAGNVQKWLREGSVVPASSIPAQVLDCQVTSDLVLENGPAEVDYIVECVVDITAALVIEAGVVIEFTENSGFGVYDGGTINAVGTEGQPIVFKGEQAVAGYWRGIHIETRSVNNRFEHVEIRNAGSNYVYCCNEASSIILKGGLMALDHVVIEDGDGSGIVATNGAEFGTFANVTITGHDQYPIQTVANAVQYFGGSGNDFSGNTKDYIYVYNSELSENATWEAANVPYLLSDNVLDITAPLVISAGTEIEVEENGGIGIYDDGTLKVTGSSSSPVVIRGKESLAGYWRGIHLETNSINNDLEYLEIYDAGSNYVYCCNEAGTLFFKSGRAALSNVTIGNSAEYGVIARKEFEFSGFSNVSVSSELEPLSLAIERVDEIEANSNLSGGSNNNFIRIVNSSVTSPVVISEQQIPYLVVSVIDVVEDLTILAGAEIAFDQNAGLGVYDQGSLAIEGTSSKPVVLTGREQVQGYWRGIHTETNDLKNSIDYAEIRYAGSNYVYCCNEKAGLLVKDGIMTLTNSIISDSGGCGVSVRSAATLTEGGNTFSNNTDGNICNP